MFRVSLRTLFLVTTIVAALASRVEVELDTPISHDHWLRLNYAPHRSIDVYWHPQRPTTVYHRQPWGSSGTSYTVLYHGSRDSLLPIPHK